MDRSRVVVIDADREYRRQVSDYLRAHDFKIIEVDGFDTFYERVGDDSRAVVVMALGADLAQALGFLKFVGARYRCPVLVLSDADDETDRVLCLELGADDVILKTASLRELLARVRAATRRLGAEARRDALEPAPISASAARGWQFLSGRRELRAPNGTPVPLTSAEYNLLDVLVMNAGTPLSRDYLSRAVFGRTYNALDRGIDNLVTRLRRKLGDPARAAQVIKTARPIGYVFTGFAGPAQDARALPAGRARHDLPTREFADI